MAIIIYSSKSLSPFHELWKMFGGLHMYFEGKTAIVTGGGGGIGAGICREFAKRGCNIFLADKFDVSQTLIDELNAMNVKVVVYKCDVGKFDACKKLIDDAVSEFGQIEYLVNNAGIVRDNLIKNMTEEEWDIVFEVDLKSCFSLTKHIWPVFEKQHMEAGETGSPGSIINMSSVIGFNANIGQANYGSAKAGVAHFTRHSAREFAKLGVTVNALAPGFIISAITDKLQGPDRERFLSTIPLKRAGTADDIAAAAVFLAENRYITGQVLAIDGGINMR